MATLFLSDRLLGVLDAMLLAAGVTATAATVAPLLQTAARWRRARRAGRPAGRSS
ncbi:MAG: hypothetical protein HY728_08075 [Candidatus Rokubacteria bacterium]|nr:hypothetical protein [Candidatus Rokubacteria bacterium]